MTRTSERARRLPRTLLALALAPLVATSGCAPIPLLTTDLWRDYAWPEPSVEEHLVERRVTQADGALAVVRPVLDHGLWWCNDSDLVPGTWVLQPQPAPGSAAEVAAALLANPDVFVVRSAAVNAVRRDVSGEIVAEEATVELDLELRTEAIGEAVAASDVSRAAANVLATVRPRAFELAVDPGRRLPYLFEDCAERLALVDLRALAGGRSEVAVEAWAFVAHDGQPVFRLWADDPDEPEAAGEDRHATLAARLAALRDVSLLVRLHGDNGSTIVRVRPDLLWLASTLQRDGDRCVHRSAWALRTAQQPLDETPSIQASRVVATMRLQEDRYQRVYYPVIVDPKLLANIALTPVTAALDLVAGPGLGDAFRELFGIERKPHELPRHDPN